MASKRRFDFPAAVAAALRELGASEGGPYGWQVATRAGLLDGRPYEDWIACRFADVARARAIAPCGSLNPFSGKWNWHFVSPTASDVGFFIDRLREIGAGEEDPTT